MGHLALIMCEWQGLQTVLPHSHSWRSQGPWRRPYMPEATHSQQPTPDQRAHSNRKLRFRGFCRSIRRIERVFWPFYSTVRSDMHYWLAFSWPYNLLSDKVLRITVYSCANASAGPSSLPLARLRIRHPLLPRDSPPDYVY